MKPVNTSVGPVPLKFKASIVKNGISVDASVLSALKDIINNSNTAVPGQVGFMDLDNMEDTKMNITEKLFSMQDVKYRDFQLNLIPGLTEDYIIGVRTPELKKISKELIKQGESDEFIKDLPHRYFEENQIHAFVLSQMKEYDRLIAETECFLPFVNNWATCDQLRPKIFSKYPDEVIIRIREWVSSDRTYTIRFGLGMLMAYFLDDKFKPEFLDIAADIRSDEYYVKMMAAWYFATALAKQYEDAVKVIEENRLDVWTHNKTIQKARESYRVSDEHKEYLKTLKRKKI